MILYTNSRGEIKDINTTEDTSLIALEVNDDMNPFANWSIAKILCYKVEVTDGVITMFTPYVNTKVIDQLDKLGKNDEVITGDVSDTQIAVSENYEKINNVTITATDLEVAVAELYELTLGGN